MSNKKLTADRFLYSVSTEKWVLFAINQINS
ncbi:MAG: hypothetical protein ACI8WM_002358 [Burkholderiaceae bacterium]